MSGLAARIAAFGGSLAGRLTVILATGIALASILSLLVAQAVHLHDFEHVRKERLVASTADIASRLARDPARTAALLGGNAILGARLALPQWREPPADAELDALLASRLGPGFAAHAGQMPRAACFPNFNLAIRAAGMTEILLPDCWYVRFRDAHGIERRLSIELPPIRLPHHSLLDPLYILLILAASTALSLVIARLVTRPLRRLTRAAHAFSVAADADPIPEQGPREVRAALHTFNVMQRRVRDGFAERTHILAAIAHDLQTPMTRLRLRLEQVEEEGLRERLVLDLSAMQRLVRDGLELARSSEDREPWSTIDVDSILSSLAEDFTDLGHDVAVVAGCRLQARVKPNALARCLTNLIDNAVKYAGDARLECAPAGDRLEICVRDSGPGIPAPLLLSVLEPFRRLPGSGVAGTGLGLTIARAQAATTGATLSLRNDGDAGLVATVSIPR